MSNHHLLDEAGFPMLAEAAAAERVDLDGRALAAAYEIALMWGEDRSQFVTRIQAAVRKAMDWAIESNSAAL